MSTHNTGFYEEIRKIISLLSSDIIKYTPYFFCSLLSGTVMPYARLMAEV